MSEPYAPSTDVAPTSPVTLLDDGNSVTFASLMQGIVAPLWDGVFYLLNHFGPLAVVEFLAGGPYTWAGAQTWNGTNAHTGTETHTGAEAFDNITATGVTNYKLASRSLTRLCDTAPMAAAANWVPAVITSVSVPIDIVWENLTAATHMVIPVHVPNGATLTAVSLTYRGGQGHGAFPGGAPDMPILRVFTQPLTFSAGTQLGTTTDPNSTLLLQATYEAYHTVAVSGLAHVVDRTAEQVFIYLTAEGGGNAVVGATDGMRYASCKVTYTTTAIDPD